MVLALVAGAMLMRFFPNGNTPAAAPPEEVATPAPLPPQNRVVILPFVNKTGDPVNDAMGQALAARVWGTVAEDSDVNVVPVAVVDEAMASNPAADSSVAAAVNAGVEVSGVVSSEGSGYRIQAVVRDLISGHLRPVEVVCPSGETVSESVVVTRLRPPLRSGLRPGKPWVPVAEPEPDCCTCSCR